MFCSGCRGKSTKKRQQQDDDDKIGEMDTMIINRRWAMVPQHICDEIQKLRTKENSLKHE
jgi:hypothetical protein